MKIHILPLRDNQIQNDVIYVTPNNAHIKGSTIGSSTNTTLSAIGILLTAAAIVVSITK